MLGLQMYVFFPVLQNLFSIFVIALTEIPGLAGDDVRRVNNRLWQNVK